MARIVRVLRVLGAVRLAKVVACASSSAARATPCCRRCWLGLLLIRTPCRKSPRRSARCF